jgi:NCAIR mutase (PurE)-related protein
MLLRGEFQSRSAGMASQEGRQIPAMIEFAAAKQSMDKHELLKILEEVKAAKLSPEQALERVKHLPFEDLDFAKVDHHRALRQGFTEVVFAKGKTPKQVREIISAMLKKKGSKHNILITRADAKTFAAIKILSKAAKYYPLSGVIAIERNGEVKGKGLIVVVSAGTSDIPVAEEALITARAMGNRADHLYDVGVAGIHRLLGHKEKLAQARVVICVEGMEGALPSVVGGLVGVPVIAVPTSVGYGASFGGVAALLGMLNSCASNVTVVNIDNGFGAACVASCINRL